MLYSGTKKQKKGLASGADKSAFAAHTEKGAMAGFEMLMKKIMYLHDGVMKNIYCKRFQKIPNPKAGLIKRIQFYSVLKITSRNRCI